jgi:ferrochelatase
MSRRRVAVVLFNLGGPDGPDAVRPFLFNLFNDPAIINLPGFLRTPLAALISSRREASAKANYALMGGGSPLLPQTRKQAAALEAALVEQLPGHVARCFVAMRYWHPLTGETAREVVAFQPEEVVLLPLYPQYSTTTTASSLKAWRKTHEWSPFEKDAWNLSYWNPPFPRRTRAVCCYPVEAGFVNAYADGIQTAWQAAGGPSSVRLLFSAHGLPESVIRSGDPYQAQVEATAAAIAERLPGLPDWQVCYQSRVGPMKWIGPSTDAAIVQASREGLSLVVSPIAFVSEHIETLVELDHEYAVLAAENGCPSYVRVPTPTTVPDFITGLARSVVQALKQGEEVCAGSAWTCPDRFICPRREGKLP